MQLFRVRNYDEYVKYCLRTTQDEADHQSFLNEHESEDRSDFTVPGFSYTAGKQVDFLVDYKHSGELGNLNWRESVACPETYFNNRMRATFHLFDILMDPYPDMEMYISEQLTPIYSYFLNRFPKTVGSEFLDNTIPSGTYNENGIRNEDLRSLTFASESFDTLVSLDVFEHIPDYQKSFSECARILKPNGKMMWSVPFVFNSHSNLVRAEIVDGQIKHIMTPEYHGDPLSDKGVLCFRHFGWEMLDEMRQAGFSDAYAILYRSTKFGYLGAKQAMFIGIK